MTDFIEIMNLCGYDMDAANEMAKREEFRYSRELLDRIMEDSCVDKIPTKPNRA